MESESLSHYYETRCPEKRISALLRDLDRFRVLGHLNWIAINLIDCEAFYPDLHNEFSNAKRFGFFESGRIYVSCDEDWMNKTYSIISLILEIIGDPNGIESITGQIELFIKHKCIDVVLEIDGKCSFPKIIEISDALFHFDR